MGLRPKSRGGSAASMLLPLLNGVWGLGVWGLGRSPGGGLGALHSCGEAAPGFGAEPQLPAYMIQTSQPVWSAARSQICLNPVWRVGCEGSRR